MLIRLIDRKFWMLGALVFFMGCASLNVPSYIQAEKPYKRNFYGKFDDVLGEVRAGLADQGWQVEKEVDPSLYERNPLISEGDKDHVLIFLKAREYQRGIYKKTVQLNVYVDRTSEGVEVDVRFRSVKNFYLFKMRAYRNDRLVKDLLDHIEKKLLLKNE